MSAVPTDTAGPYAAHRGAARVVGLYGDPDVSWSIVLEARLRHHVDVDEAGSALEDLVSRHPHLGPVPSSAIVPEADLPAARDDLANRVYTVPEPLVRCVLGEDGRTVLLACHHGVADGIGLLGLLGAVVGLDLRSGARGISEATSGTGFARRAVSRFREAALRPPQRLHPVRGSGAAPGRGDWLVSRAVTSPLSTAVLVAAARRAVHEWNGAESAGTRRRPVVLAIGASRRPSGSQPSPDRQAAYLRLADVPYPLTVHDARELLRQTPPEPTFPATTGLGIGPLLTRALASRLGSTLLLSNLADVRSLVEIDRLAFFPATGGPSAVAVGLATVAGRSTLTVRARRRDFTEAAATELGDLFSAALTEVAPPDGGVTFTGAGQGQ